MEQFEVRETAPRDGWSSRTKVLVGCGVTAAVVIVLVCGGVVGFILWGLGKMDDFAEPFEAQGYARVSGQQISVTTPIAEPTVFTGQVVVLEADAEADVAIFAQTADIRGLVDGDVDFYGQVLTVHRNAVITGDLRIKGAQVVDIRGRVEGEVTGSYQTLNRADDEAPDEQPEESDT